MNWQILNSEVQLAEIIELSNNKFVTIFKHSTRCSISSSAKDRLERKWNKNIEPKMVFYYLDLIRFRDISNKIAQDFNVEHQSPQVLVIKDGVCVYNASHMEIRMEEIMAAVS